MAETQQATKTYTAILTFADGATEKVTFKSRGVHTSTVTGHARKAAEKAGYNSADFSIFASDIKEQS